MIVMTKRRGFNLLEMLCAMALLTVMAGVAALILRQTLEMESVQRHGFERMLQTTELANQFRADVACAEAAPQRWHIYKADSRTLILQMKKNAYVVYRWDEGTLVRHNLDEKDKSERNLPLDAMPMDVEFTSVGPESKLIRMRLTALRGGKSTPGQTLEIAAALGGDWR